ncbi:MAG: hypothetical protein Q9227_004364 [Pyrenula ochraceoflavens]
MTKLEQTKTDLHIGICGAGIGGLMAAIAIAEAGARVTVLEAAHELGEIGAGIQMTPNAARLLIRWGVDKVVGDNLVECAELNMRRKDGTRVGYTKMIPEARMNLGIPWWVVHRAHVHAGLTEVAIRNGAEIVTNARVENIDWKSQKGVNVLTVDGRRWTFNLLVGADGVSSTVRRAIMPEVRPTPPTKNCAFRAVVPYDKIRADPVAKELAEKLTMDIWMAPSGYIISYPISGGRDCNMVLEHHADHLVHELEEIDIKECREMYKDFDPRIRRVVDMIESVKRWPLLLTGPLNSWSTTEKNVVLIGDAAHSMTNHMAQGAATSMEDGAFLGRTITAVVEGKLSLIDAVRVYEMGRMPRADLKQQVSYLNGVVYQLPDGPLQEARDKAMSVELSRPSLLVRTPNLYGNPQTWLDVYAYDAEDHAEKEISAFLRGEKENTNTQGVRNREIEDRNPTTGVTTGEMEKYLQWWWPKQEPLEVAKL